MKKEINTVEQRWDITYTHATGKTAGKFLTELALNRILGIRCPKCERVLVPPRSFCDRCFVETKQWIQVRNEGFIEAFTIVHHKFQGFPDPPWAVISVRLDGADTAIQNIVKGLDLHNIMEAKEKLKIGERAKVVFKKEPEGRVTDFWFEPVDN
jgi:uncharacterized OB-fold protein